MSRLAEAGDIRILTDDFNTVPIPRMEMYIDMAQTEIVGEGYTEALYLGDVPQSELKKLCMFLACHYMVVWGAVKSGAGVGSGAGSGQVTRMKVDQVEVGYGSVNTSAKDYLPTALTKTKWGLEYSRLRARYEYGFELVRGCP